LEEIKIGIIAAPEFPTNIANSLKEKLTNLFSKEINSEVFWEIEVVTDALTSVAEDGGELLDEMSHIRKNKDWDYVLSLSDIPIYFKDKAILARVNHDEKNAVLSIPAFGWFMKKRITVMLLQLVEDIYYQNSSSTTKNRKNRFKDTFRFNKIQVNKTIQNEKVIWRYLFSNEIGGKLTLLSGMTYANQPWKLVTSLRRVLAVAFGTGAYGLIFPSLWQVSYEYHPLRLALIMVLSIVGMSIWIIHGHNLWEIKTEKSSEKIRRLYNGATVSTLLLAVGYYYIILGLLFIITTHILVAPDFFAQQVGLSTLPAFVHYLQLAWVVTSIATIAGAVGVGLENEENVRNATYGYRQRKRYNEMEEEKKKQEKEQYGVNEDDETTD